MYLATSCLFVVVAAAAVVAGCSINADQSTPKQLAGPSHGAGYYADGDRYRDDQRRHGPPRYTRPVQPVPPRDRYVAQPAYGQASANCSNERVAAPPFPAHLVVTKGDNLCRIAKRYQTTVQAIVDENQLSSPILPVGMRLRLPSPAYYSQSPFGQLQRR